jgi:hypothetical protein
MFLRLVHHFRFISQYFHISSLALLLEAFSTSAVFVLIVAFAATFLSSAYQLALIVHVAIGSVFALMAAYLFYTREVNTYIKKQKKK